MSLLEQMLPGQVWDPGLLARMLPGEAPDPVVSALAGIPVEMGVAFVPVPGPPGSPGPPGTGLNFTQSVPSALWTINHNLGYYPSVAVFTTGGVEVDGGVHHLSPNIVQIDFAGPLAGSARLI